MIKNNQGQVQLIVALSSSVIVLTLALYAFYNTQRSRERQSLATYRLEMRNALNSTIKQLANIYREQASCDPASLQEKVSRIDINGQMQVPGTYGRRQITEASGSHIYTVSIGRIWGFHNGGAPTTVVAPYPPNNALDPQDAIVEVFTSFNDQRVYETAVLINNCTTPCTYTSCFFSTASPPYIGQGTCNGTTQPASDPCSISVSTTPPIGYFAISMGTYPAGGGVTSPSGTSWVTAANHKCGPAAAQRFRGDLKSFPAIGSAAGTCGAPNNTVEVNDLVVLRNHVRGGDLAGSCQAVMYGAGASESCADLNRDGLVNETDINILEKFMRGYLYWLPTRY